jgi:Tfp pilus assembly protein PilF
MAEALQQLATVYMVEGQLDSALIEAHEAYRLAPRDTLDFRAQTLLLLAQIHLMAEEGDSVEHYVMQAKRLYPKVEQTDLYRITHAYGLVLQDKDENLMAVLPSYISQSGIHGQAELTRLLM